MTTKEEKARREGIAYAIRYARENGLDALEEDAKKRAAYNIPLSVGKRELDEFCENVKNMTMDTMLILTLVTLHDEFGFGTKRLQQFQDRFDFKASCLVEDFTNWQEQIEILKEECNIDLTIRENNKNVKIK